MATFHFVIFSERNSNCMQITIINECNVTLFQPFLARFSEEEGVVQFGLIVNQIACGTALLRKSFEAIALGGVKQVNCQVAFRPFGGDSGIKSFLEHCGFCCTGAVAFDYSLSLQALYRSSLSNRDCGIKASVRSLSEISDKNLPALIALVEKTPKGKFSASLMRLDNISKELSLCIILERRLAGYLIVMETAPKEMEITVLYSDGTNKMLPLTILRAATDLAIEHCPADTIFNIRIYSSKMQSFADKLLYTQSHHKKPVFGFMLNL